MASSAFDLAHGLLAHTLSCEQVRLELSSRSYSIEGPNALVHFLEHFVADQDIRSRDLVYAQWQEAKLRKLLATSDG